MGRLTMNCTCISNARLSSIRLKFPVKPPYLVTCVMYVCIYCIYIVVSSVIVKSRRAGFSVIVLSVLSNTF